MYHSALEYGLMPGQIDDLSLGELADVLEAKSNAFKQKQKAKSLICHSQALDIASRLGMMLSDKEDAKAPEIWELYAGFEAEKEKSKKREEEMLLAKQKAAMQVYVERANRQFGLKEGET